MFIQYPTLRMAPVFVFPHPSAGSHGPLPSSSPRVTRRVPPEPLEAKGAPGPVVRLVPGLSGAPLPYLPPSPSPLPNPTISILIIPIYIYIYSFCSAAHKLKFFDLTGHADSQT